MMDKGTRAVVNHFASLHGIDPFLLTAIVFVESSGNRFATRYEPGYSYFEKPEYWAETTGVSLDTELAGQKTSWGLPQIMGGTARWLGFRGMLPELCEAETGLTYGCLYLKRQLSRYSGNMHDAIAAYNAGTVQKINHHYSNQKYVDKVLKAYEEAKR